MLRKHNIGIPWDLGSFKLDLTAFEIISTEWGKLAFDRMKR